MAARARLKLACAVNAELNGVIPEQPIEEIDFSMQYILEVDMEYPREIHDRDDDYPFAPELMESRLRCFPRSTSSSVASTTVPPFRTLVC